MKTYKHKTKGYKAESEGSSPYSYVVYMPDRIITLPAQLVEDPGFGWVLQKDYEILEVKSNWSDEVYRYDEITLIGNHGIHSVKRLSDNFTMIVGDKDETGAVVTGFTEKDGKMMVRFHSYYRELNEIGKPEKDYEILKVKHRMMGNIVSELEPSTWWDIYSVKRLSDGEVISVGEERRSELLSGIVTGFEEREESIWVYIHGIGINLNIIQKARKPILTSEDGVDMFEGDKGFWINESHADPTWAPYEIIETTINKHCSAAKIKWFSTREAAEKYRMNYARVFSLSDIGTSLLQYDIEGVKYFKNLVKSRL